MIDKISGDSMINNEFKVSVIIPTYKRSDFLVRAIKSVLNQTYKNIQVVVVDDNENNSNFRKETEDKIKEFNLDNRVLYIKNAYNMGGGKARNEGINRCDGEYITFLDDDDIYLEEKIEVQLKHMLKNKLDVSFTDLRLHNMKDKIVDYREFKFIKSFKNDDLLKYHLTRHITGTPTFMYKKDTLEKINGFRDVKMAQEFYLMLDTIESGARIGYIPRADVIAYLHDGEKISSGLNKINGEKNLFKSKQEYFYKLTSKEKKYIKFRHRAVMTVAYKRNREYTKATFEAVKAIGFTPIIAIYEIFMFFKKVDTNK